MKSKRLHLWWACICGDENKTIIGLKFNQTISTVCFDADENKTIIGLKYHSHQSVYEYVDENKTIIGLKCNYLFVCF